MPININDQDYVQAERDFYKADCIEDQLAALNKMISHAPGHKGAENLRQQLTTRRKKLELLLVKQKRSRKTSTTGIKKEDMQAMLVGKTNSGKSSLMRVLTNTYPKIADYDFTTRAPLVGMMDYATAQVQLIENPAVESEYYDKGIPHTADTILIIINSIKDIEEIIPKVEKHPNKKIIVFNKIDLLSDNEKRKIKATLKSKKKDFVMVSTFTMDGIEDLKKKIFGSFDILRVYTKEPNKPKTKKPMIMRPGSTVKNVAEKILTGFSKRIKQSRIYGPSAKFLGQGVGLKHKLKDLDVVEFKTK